MMVTSERCASMDKLFRSRLIETCALVVYAMTIDIGGLPMAR
jgi:hypothetical protein